MEQVLLSGRYLFAHRASDSGAGACDGLARRAAKPCGSHHNLESLADRVATYCAIRGSALRPIQIDKLNKNAFIERFHWTVGHEVCEA